MATLYEVEAILMVIVDSIDFEELSVRDGLAKMIRDFDRTAREDADVVKVWLDWNTGFRADVWLAYLRMQKRVEAAIQKALTRGKRQGVLSERLNTKAAARLFIGGGRTVVLTRFSGASEREIEILIDHLIESVLCIGAHEMSHLQETDLEDY